MQEIWNIEDIINATAGTLHGEETEVSIQSVSIDSRTIEKGALFIALKGENFDGHQFVESAFEKGAVAVLVDHTFSESYKNKNHVLIAVEDTEKALVNLGAYRRKQSKAFFVGVTGSVGKTSVKEMLRTALSAHGLTYATQGNLNNHLGTPLSLSRIPLDTKFAVMEMGMNHSGEIEFLTNMVKPNVSIINNIEAVHLEHFESLEKIADAKAEIFLGQEEGSIAVLNKDNPFFDYLVQKANKTHIAEIIAFGEDDQAELCMSHYNADIQEVTIENNLDDTEISYKLGVVGKHQALNSCGVLAVVAALGLDIKRSAEALESYQAQKGRGEFKDVTASFGLFRIIDDCYNAGPASVKAAIETVKPLNQGRVIAVLGDMLELGETAKELHASLAEVISQSKVNKVYTVGNLMQHLFDALPDECKAGAFSDINASIKAISDSLQDNDTVLIKGSNGMKMRVLVDALAQLEDSKIKTLVG